MIAGVSVAKEQLVSPSQLAESFERDLRDANYVAEIETSRKQMIDGNTVEWHTLAK